MNNPEVYSKLKQIEHEKQMMEADKAHEYEKVQARRNLS